MIRRHRAIWQADSARDFSSRQGLKSAGILYVFQAFQTTELAEKDNGSVGTIIFIIVALLTVGGDGYYVKIVRPKQQAEDDEDFEEDGYGEGFDPDEAYGEPEYLSEEDFDDKDGE